MRFFGDGSARPIEDDIEPKVYDALVTRAGDDATPENP